MNVSEPCLICNSNTNCDCKGGLLRFFTILEGVQSRVLRTEAASHSPAPKIKSVGVDKLNGYFRESLPTDLVREQAASNGLQIRSKFLRDRKNYLEIGRSTEVIHLKLSPDTTVVTGFVANPNRFQNWPHFYETFASITPHGATELAQVTRLDLNLDFNITYQQLLMSLDFEMKRDSLSYMDSSGIRTGLVIGKGDESVLIYDKGFKEKIHSDWSRIELRLTGQKLPSRSICNLPQAIVDCKPFSNVRGLSVSPKENYQLNDKAVQFLEQTKRDGFFVSKKSCNLSRNFHRNILSHLEVKYWEQQPSELFEVGINQFLNPKESNYEHTNRCHA